MAGLPLNAVLYFFLFNVFLFYQQYHARTFRGASQSYLMALQASVTVWFVAEVGFLIWYGITTTLWHAAKLFVLAIFGVGIFSVIEIGLTRGHFIGALMGLIGFVGLPVCFVLLIKAI